MTIFRSTRQQAARPARNPGTVGAEGFRKNSVWRRRGEKEASASRLSRNTMSGTGPQEATYLGRRVGKESTDIGEP